MAEGELAVVLKDIVEKITPTVAQMIQKGGALRLNFKPGAFSEARIIDLKV